MYLNHIIMLEVYNLVGPHCEGSRAACGLWAYTSAVVHLITSPFDTIHHIPLVIELGLAELWRRSGRYLLLGSYYDVGLVEIEAAVFNLLKRLTLVPLILNYHPVSNFSFGGKVVEKVVRLQLQLHKTLEEAYYLDRFQTGIRMGLNWENFDCTCWWAIADPRWKWHLHLCAPWYLSGL